MQTRLFDDRVARLEDKGTHFEILNRNELGETGLVSCGKRLLRTCKHYEVTKEIFERMVKDSYDNPRIEWVNNFLILNENNEPVINPNHN